MIVKSNVIVVLLYGCESWRMTKGDEAKLDTFQHKCLRRLLKIYWPMHVSNEEVCRRANIETISKLVRKRRWTWIGHVLRMDNSCLPQVALTWALEGKCKRGRPKETWRRTVEKERMAMGFNSWVEALLVAANRVSWRSVISGLFSIRREGTDDDENSHSPFNFQDLNANSPYYLPYISYLLLRVKVSNLPSYWKR